MRWCRRGEFNPRYTRSWSADLAAAQVFGLVRGVARASDALGQRHGDYRAMHSGRSSARAMLSRARLCGAIIGWATTEARRLHQSWGFRADLRHTLEYTVLGASRPVVDRGGGGSERCAKRCEVVGVAGQDVVAQTNGGDHQVGVDDVC